VDAPNIPIDAGDAMMNLGKKAAISAIGFGAGELGNLAGEGIGNIAGMMGATEAGVNVVTKTAAAVTTYTANTVGSSVVSGITYDSQTGEFGYEAQPMFDRQAV
jgi:hypothetical protein